MYVDQDIYIDSLFSYDVQYEVPLYQRRYVWNETNWRTLWEDILSQLDPELEEENRGHFIGPIVTRPIGGRQRKRFEIIDGQQRLTTFQIIFCVIRDLCESQGHGDLAKNVQTYLVNPDIAIQHVRRINTSEHFPDPTYKLIPTTYDKLTFQEVVEEKYGKAIPQAFDESENRLNPEAVKKVRSQVFGGVDKVSRSILDAYDYFYMQITAYVGKDCDYNGVIDLITSIKHDFRLVPIVLDRGDQPEKIFESLNATGRMLSEFDYLRNNLFLRAGKAGEKERQRLYNEYWKHFENHEHYWDAENLNSFFRAFLIAKLGPNCFEAKNVKLFELYREYSKTLVDIEYEFKQLKDYAESYKEINYEMNKSTSEIRRHLQFYDHLQLPRLDAFILFVKHKLGNEPTNRVCDILESYIVRQMLCHSDNQYSYETINTFFSKAIKDYEFRIEEFAEFLSKSEPSGDQVTSAFKQVGSKDAEFISYIFRRMENWKKEENTLWGYKPLNWEEQMTLLSEIQNNLEEIDKDDSKLVTLHKVFNEVWAPVKVYLTM